MELFFPQLAEAEKRGDSFAWCIIVDSKGSVPRKAGAKMIVYPDKSIQGTVGGGNVEQEIINHAIEAIKSGKPRKLSINLKEDVSMQCGGSVEAYIEPVLANKPLYIFGAGHVGMALAKMAKDFGFKIIVVDDREDIINEAESLGADTIKSEFVKAASEIDFPDNAFITVLTPMHKYDEEVLKESITKNYTYLGVISSRKKVKTIKDNLIATGINEKLFEKVDMPIGVPIQSDTPEEIAISILAKLIDVKNKMY